MNCGRFENLPPLPLNIRLTKGSVHIIASRAFVEFVVHNEIAIKFRDWIDDSFYPDETFFSSLNHSPKLGVPGAYLGLYISWTFSVFKPITLTLWRPLLPYGHSYKASELSRHL